ncbi:HEAT repeat protein [Rhizobium aethiopicum]|uniref:HEAT repeat protein n=1 Tax=Rhizobium aethiopicum TaxID=1138170 RepID=A0A7W6QEC2_9HYPH|nr:HEAT repeat domain-containing protein [Rhizobium aethiopicum]MBB4195996.1 HEAT repeat protein [Rhizobium aethiopicum]MBB4583648.1 HEAT repeat protein [Rhizobium aethiopicum]
MIESERELIMELVPLRYTQFVREPISKAEFLKQFRGARDGTVLANELLAEAIESKIPDDVECALIVGSNFGFNEESLDFLLQLLKEDWHFKHEDVVSALGQLKAPKAIDALYHATQWIPAYLEFEARAFAVKAIWALGAISSPEAQATLIALSGDQNAIIKQNALNQLSRRPQN